MKPEVLFKEAQLRRNYQDLRFTPQDHEEDLRTSYQRSLRRIQQLSPDVQIVASSGQGNHALDYLEEHLLAAKLSKLNHAALLKLPKGQGLVNINTDDHLVIRMRSHHKPFDQLVSEARGFETLMGDDLHPFARNERFDYLSYRMVLSGSGLYLRYLLHLPMLGYLRQIPSLNTALKELACVLKPLGQSGTPNPTRLFVLENTASFALSDEQLIHSLQAAAQLVIDREAKLQQKALNNPNSSLQDQIWRAYGMLSHARRLGKGELLSQYNYLRLGAQAGILPLRPEQADALLDFAGEAPFKESKQELNHMSGQRASAVRQALTGGN